MIDLDATGHRFRHLPHVVDLDAGHRAIGDVTLPFIGQVGAQIDHEAEIMIRAIRRAVERLPLDPGNLADISRLALGNEVEVVGLGTPGDQIGHVEPGQTDDIAGQKFGAAVFDAPEQDEREEQTK
jgi:hypothetical protein